MRRLLHAPIIALLAACTTSRPAPSEAPHAPAAVAAPTVAALPAPSAPCCKDAPPCCDEAPARKDQPPELKLKLGHFSNTRRGIGLVFDRSTAQAKVRFDGASQTLQLDRQHGSADRIDYIRSIGHVVLQEWSNGRVVVYVADGGDGIDVRRDGDADPL